MPRSDNNWRQQQEAARIGDRVVETIESYITQHGYSPTRKEVAEKLDLSERTVRRHVVKLIEEGKLTDAGGPRTLRVAE